MNWLKKTMGVATLILCAVALIGATGCDDTSRNQTSASGAKQINPCKVPKNAEDRTVEQQNIYDRIKVTTDPTKVMWIHLVSLDGTIIRRMPVRNKVTSSGKRLEPTAAASSAYQDTVRFWAPFQSPFNPNITGHEACFLMVNSKEQ